MEKKVDGNKKNFSLVRTTAAKKIAVKRNLVEFVFGVLHNFQCFMY